MIIHAEGATAFDELTRFGGDAFLLAANGWAQFYRIGRTIPAVEYLQANRLREQLVEDMAALMNQIDVYAGAQPEMVDGVGSAISNLTGQPCVVVVIVIHAAPPS